MNSRGVYEARNSGRLRYYLENQETNPNPPDILLHLGYIVATVENSPEEEDLLSSLMLIASFKVASPDRASFFCGDYI